MTPAQQRAALALAMVEEQLAAHASGDPADAKLHLAALGKLADDPEALAKVLVEPKPKAAPAKVREQVQPTPVQPISITVNVPPAPQTVVNVDARQEPPQVTVPVSVSIPESQQATGPQEVVVVSMPTRVTEVERNADGDMQRTVQRDVRE